MKKRLFAFICALTILFAPVAHAAADGPPWRNFIPALVIVPIVLIWIFLSSTKENSDNKGSSPDKDLDEQNSSAHEHNENDENHT